MDKDTLGSFDKTADQMSTQLITQILKVFQGYLANSLSDAFARTFKKVSERFNERNIGLKTRSWTAGFGDLSLFTITSLNGIVGDKSLAAVFSTDIQPVGDAMALTKYCHIDESGFFPDPSPNWLRGISLDPYLRANPANTPSNQSTSQISIPVQTLNYLFWKAFGSAGTCNWSYPDNISKDLSLSIRYSAPWRVRFSPSQDGQPITAANSSSVVVQIPSLRLTADIPFLDKVIQALKDNGFANNADDLRQLDYTLTAFEYPIQIVIDRSKNLLRFAVQNEDSYLSKDMSRAPEIVLDIVDQLRNKSEFSAATLSLKKDLLVKAIISSILNQNLAKKLHDAEIRLQNPIDQTKLVAQTVAINEKSIQVFLTGQLGSISQNPGLSNTKAISQAPLGKDTLANLQEPVAPTSTLTAADATSSLANLGIANVIGSQSEVGITQIQTVAQKFGQKCSQSGHISLPISEDAATIANYVTCSKGTTSVEYRVHTEKASLVNASPESPIVYTNVRYQRPVTKDLKPTQVDGGVPTYDSLFHALRKPSSDFVKDGFFVSNWAAETLNVSVLGFCSNMQADAGTCDNSQRIITGVRLWQN